MNCKAVILEGENKGKQCTRAAGDDGMCGKHRLDARCGYIHPYGEHKETQCSRRASHSGYCVSHKDYIHGRCDAIIEQGANKGSQCTRPCLADTRFCGKHQKAKHITEIKERGSYKCYTHRCVNSVSAEKTYCTSCIEHKHDVLTSKQCIAIIQQGPRAGERCTNTTDDKYCGKHAERSFLREYAKCMGKKLCDNGARCTTIIDNDKAHCDECLAHTRLLENRRNIITAHDITKCYTCGKHTTAFAKNKSGNNSRYCIDCYEKLRLVEDCRTRNVHTQKPEKYYEDYKKDAHKRQYMFELSFDEFRNIIVRPCYYCGIIKELEYNGVDRVDNTLHYTVSNCVPACKLCNLMKSNHTIKEFVNHCKAITLYQESKSVSDLRLIWPSKNNCPYSTYKKSTATRGLAFELTEDQYKSMRCGSCYLCGNEGTVGAQNGIDRIDSTKGYIMSNCASCCAWCNRFKNTTPLDVFIEQCKKINSHIVDYTPITAYSGYSTVPSIPM